MIKYLLFISSIIVTHLQKESNTEMKSVSKNGMAVRWEHNEGTINFEMEAPTQGWVTIGFNNSSGTKDAYLLMGRVVNGKTEVIEHYTLKPGNYKSFEKLGVGSSIRNVTGNEQDKSTLIKFSLPTKSINKYKKELSNGLSYNMILAYSRSDDFQHHSMMRTSIKVTL
jgi:hypothetical protein